VHELLTLGETMRITDGPFAGFNGVVATLPNVPIGTLDESTRVGLLVEAFGRRSPIEFEFGQLEKL
jgi:transcriptional antiterminator NusG